MTPLKNNLVALGSAAVLAVYSAGFVRTRAAAERFAVEDSERRRTRSRRAQQLWSRPRLSLSRDRGAGGKPSTPTELPRHEAVAAQSTSRQSTTRGRATDSAPKLADSSAAPVAPPVDSRTQASRGATGSGGAARIAVKPPTPPATDSTEQRG